MYVPTWGLVLIAIIVIYLLMMLRTLTKFFEEFRESKDKEIARTDEMLRQCSAIMVTLADKFREITDDDLTVYFDEKFIDHLAWHERGHAQQETKRFKASMEAERKQRQATKQL